MTTAEMSDDLSALNYLSLKFGPLFFSCETDILTMYTIQALEWMCLGDHQPTLSVDHRCFQHTLQSVKTSTPGRAAYE